MKNLITGFVVLLFGTSNVLAACQLNTKAACGNFIKSLSFTLPDKTNYSDLDKQIKECQQDQSYKQACAQCMKPLERFVAARLSYMNNGMGMTDSNTSYLNAQDIIDPEMMTIPSELMTTTPNAGSEPPSWKVDSFPIWNMYKNDFKDSNWQALEAQGYKHLVYSSRTVPNPPHNSMRRLLVFVPGLRYDRWIQFTLPDISKPDTKETVIDFIAVEKKDLSDNTLEKPRIHFRQYHREYTDSTVTKLVREDKADYKCFACHASGMRILNPDPGSFIGAQKLNLTAMNKTMTSYNLISWANNSIVPQDHGPALGTRSGCVRCHDNGSSISGPLTWTLLDSSVTGVNNVQHKVVNELTMPSYLTLTAFRKVMHDLADIEFLTPVDRLEFLKELRGVDQKEKHLKAIDLAHKHSQISLDDRDQLKALVSSYQLDGDVVYKNVLKDAPDELEAWLTQNSCE